MENIEQNSSKTAVIERIFSENSKQHVSTESLFLDLKLFYLDLFDSTNWVGGIKYTAPIICHIFFTVVKQEITV